MDFRKRKSKKVIRKKMKGSAAIQHYQPRVAVQELCTPYLKVLIEAGPIICMTFIMANHIQLGFSARSPTFKETCKSEV